MIEWKKGDPGLYVVTYDYKTNMPSMFVRNWIPFQFYKQILFCLLWSVFILVLLFVYELWLWWIDIVVALFSQSQNKQLKTQIYDEF